MRTKLLLLLALSSAACGDDGGNATRLDSGFVASDAPEFEPTLTSFQATPSQVPSGVPTDIVWNWTFAQEPTFPTPTCSIDNGVGPVTKGQTIPITITAVTTFTLTCINNAGMAQRQVVVGVPPVGPQLATFTATPAGTLNANQAGNVTFAWTYTNSPTPAPTCVVDGDVGTVTNGQTVSVTLPRARTFRLRCTNSAGTTFRDATTVAVTECGITAACGNNSTCTDTTESYTCACASGYTGDGNTCSLLTAQSGDCDPNATYIGGACICNAGFIGNGATCTRAKIAFVTSTTGNGNLSTWSDATGTGLAAADSVCMARALAAGLPNGTVAGSYVAWMSDANNDAYCRVQGLSGKRSNNCGLGALPSAAGPWIRLNDRRPFAPSIGELTGTNRYLYYPAIYNESGTEITTVTDRVWTGTDENGVAVANTCNDWQSSSTSFYGVQGFTHGGATTWTKPNTLVNTSDPNCLGTARLRCVETGAGPALPPRHPTGSFKRAFVTSVSGNGNFLMWPDGVGASTGLNAADQICQARARYAGYTNALAFKAFIAGSSSIYDITDRIFTTTAPYIRPDGVVIGNNRSGLLSGKLAAPWSQTETGGYVQGNAETGPVWTGAYYYGTYVSSSYSCLGWSTTSSYNGYIGHHDMLDTNAIGNSGFPSSAYQSCSQTARIYCVED